MISNYREQVQRVLSLYHARIELGLSRAREQETFAHQVAAVLKRNQVPFKAHLNRDFNVVFKISIKDIAYLSAMFLGYVMELEGNVYVLSEPMHDGVQVTLEVQCGL